MTDSNVQENHYFLVISSLMLWNYLLQIVAMIFELIKLMRHNKVVENEWIVADQNFQKRFSDKIIKACEYNKSLFICYLLRMIVITAPLSFILVLTDSLNYKSVWLLLSQIPEAMIKFVER